MNFKELKMFCAKLTDAELKEKVILWREDEAITNIEVQQLQEDYCI